MNRNSSIAMSPLNRFPLGRRASVESIDADGDIRARLLDLGLIPGTTIEPVLSNRSGDLVAYRFRGVIMALRAEDAALVQVRPSTDPDQ